ANDVERVGWVDGDACLVVRCVAVQLAVSVDVRRHRGGRAAERRWGVLEAAQRDGVAAVGDAGHLNGVEVLVGHGQHHISITPFGMRWGTLGGKGRNPAASTMATMATMVAEIKGT